MVPSGKNRLLLIAVLAATLLATGAGEAQAFGRWGGCCWGWGGCGWGTCGWGGWGGYSYCGNWCYDPCWYGYYWPPYYPGVPPVPGHATGAKAQEPSPSPNNPLGPMSENTRAMEGLAVESSATSGAILLSLPQDARVVINGRETTITGPTRKYVSENLKPGSTYKYEIRATIVRDGKMVEEKRVVYLKAGQSEQLAFSFPATPEPHLALTP